MRTDDGGVLGRRFRRGEAETFQGWTSVLGGLGLRLGPTDRMLFFTKKILISKHELIMLHDQSMINSCLDIKIFHICESDTEM